MRLTADKPLDTITMTSEYSWYTGVHPIVMGEKGSRVRIPRKAVAVLAECLPAMSLGRLSWEDGGARLTSEPEDLPVYNAQKDLPGPGRVQFQPQEKPAAVVAVSFRIQFFCCHIHLSLLFCAAPRKTRGYSPSSVLFWGNRRNARTIASNRARVSDRKEKRAWPEPDAGAGHARCLPEWRSRRAMTGGRGDTGCGAARSHRR